MPASDHRPRILLCTLNARFSHASLGLRYLLANLGDRPATFAEAPRVEIWRCGDASEPGALGPWSVRWSLE